MSNLPSSTPLLSFAGLPPVSQIERQHVLPAVEQAMADCRAEVERVLSQDTPYTWANLCEPLAEVNDRRSRLWSPVGQLNAVKNSPEVREAYQQCLPLLSEYGTWMGQHAGLYQAYK
ncbi:oligopeptidase A, partial [Plesiomonas shigelloides]|nr:oligopeptidase A [Plesiomonas shigelloides]